MKSIQAKLTASVLAIFLVAMVTLGALNYWKARSMVVENVSENMNQLAVDAANDITSWLRISQAELLGLAAAPPIQGGNPQEASAFLANVMKNNKFFLALIYVTPDFHYYNSAGPTGVLSAQTIPYVKKALNGEATISEPVASKVDGQLASIVTVPIKVNGQVTGALMGSVRLTDLTQKILNKKVGETGYAYVQSKDGLIIMHPDKDIAMQANGITDDKLSSAMKAIGQAMVNGEHGLSQYEINGVEKMTSFTPIVGTDWSLALTVPTKEVTGPVSSLTMISLLTTLLVLILAVFFIAWLARCIARPIQKLEVAANRIAAGDISQIKLDINSSDEIGQLGRSFEQMSGNLRGLIQKIHGAAEQVAASSQELTASSEQSAQVANQIAASIGNVASGASEQVAAANDTTVVVEQISAGIQQIAANTNQVAAHSVQAAEKAKYGDKAVEKAVAQMDQIKDTVNLSARVVSKLGERSKEIGQIVDTISGIAGQTNLLALNAAIEAARAGEQGRGFAVVAEEVRKLAEQSQEAAKKIAGLIGEIQEDTDKAVVAMDNGTQEVKTGAEVVNTAGSAFREIADLVTGVSGQVKEISAAMQQMASSSQNIVDSVKKIDILGKKSADEVHGVSAATEEQLASMEEIASSSQALANLAADLQEAVSEFQV